MSVVISTWGCLYGWLTVLFIARHDIIFFLPDLSTSAFIANYCVYTHYPKAQDYFWYLAMLIGGLAGSASFSALHYKFMNSRKDYPARNTWPLALHGTSSLALLALLSSKSMSIAASPFNGILLLVSGGFLAVYSIGSHKQADKINSARPGAGFNLKTRYILFASLISLAWLADPRMNQRPLDTIHEGVHLSYYQSSLQGDRTGLDITGEYSPLYTNTVNIWMNIFSPTVSTLRKYFLTVQALGTALLLLILFSISASFPVRLLGIGAILLQTTASPYFFYGWANPIRLAMPLLAWFILWKSLSPGSIRLAVLAGLISGIALTYSAEFAIAGIIASCFLVATSILAGGANKPAVLRLFMAWILALLAGFICTALIIFRADFLQALSNMLQQSYITSRLGGHASRPLPPFQWFSSPGDLVSNASTNGWAFFLWIPGLVAGISLATTIGLFLDGRKRDIPPLVGLSIFALFAQVPALARPLGIPASTFPPTILLAVLLITGVSRHYSWRNPAVILVGVLLAIGVATGPSWSQHLPPHIFLKGQTNVRPCPEIPRLGAVEATEKERNLISRSARIIREYCAPQGEYVFISDSFNPGIAFFADRPAMPPYPEPLLASTPDQRHQVLKALEKYRPKLAIIGIYGIDVPFTLQFPDQWEYICKNYRLLVQIQETAIYLRKDIQNRL